MHKKLTVWPTVLFAYQICAEDYFNDAVEVNILGRKLLPCLPKILKLSYYMSYVVYISSIQMLFLKEKYIHICTIN